MRAASTKSSLVKMFKEETEVMTSGFHRQGDWKTTVVVDAMHAIHRWSFKKNETFGNIADRYNGSHCHIEERTKIVSVVFRSLSLCCVMYDSKTPRKRRQKQGKNKMSKIHSKRSTASKTM